MAKIIGIDLGTSNSAASVMSGGRPATIPSSEGVSLYGKAFPSYVAFTKDGQMLVGEPAKRQAVSNPDATASGFKRKMGTDYKYTLAGKQYSPQQLSAFLLQKIKKDAESFLGEEVKQAVITVPAYFNDNQRQATKDAGEIAGLEVIRIINEPTAASLAYGIDKGGKNLKILVFDLGGGTLDVTIMDFGGGVFQVLSTNGDTQLGGRDMDDTLQKYLVEMVKRDTGADISKDSTAIQRIREAGETAKIELSTVVETEVNLPYVTVANNQPQHFRHKLTRAKLEELINPIIGRCRAPMENALKDAKLTSAGIDKVILVGGPTRMPMVQKFVEDAAGKKAERGVDPMECVALGAAVQAGALSGEVKDILLLDVTPLSLGLETLGGIFTRLIDRNTTIPVKKSQVFTTAADSQTSVEIKVYQGERSMARDNIQLGTFALVGIPPAPRGMPQIEVTFDIDANGILHVTAKDTATNKEQKMKITAPHKMSKDDIEKNRKSAEEFAEQDRKLRDFIDAKNEGESLVYTSKKSLEEFKDKIDGDTKSKIEAAMKVVEEKIRSDDTGTIQDVKKAVEELRNALQQIGAKIYGGQNQARAGSAPGSEQSPGQGPGTEPGNVPANETVNGDYKKA